MSVLFISLIVVVFFIFNSKKKEIEHEQLLQQQQLDIQQQKENADAKEKYQKLCSEYNNKVEAYNDSVSDFNVFLKQAEKYNLFGDASVLKEEQSIKEDFESFKENGCQFSSLEKSIETISNNKELIDSKHRELLQSLYNSLIDEYNTLAQDYRNLMGNTSVAFITSIPTAANPKSKKDDADFQISDEEKIFEEADILCDQISKLTENYVVSYQITAPEEAWVIERLKKIKTITGIEAVTKEHDPNKLLNVEGGYKACVYFTVDKIAQDSVPGDTVIEKGTDAGGAIEVYPDLKSAENRCDYLSGFDNTLLYSGSYVLVGTMVVRTSYKLSNEEQINLTNDIITSFTEIQA